MCFPFVILEDELVSLDELQDKVAEFEDYVQSSDIAAMQSKCDSPRLQLSNNVLISSLSTCRTLICFLLVLNCGIEKGGRDLERRSVSHSHVCCIHPLYNENSEL